MPTGRRLDAERERLAEADTAGVPWRRWGPYLAERAWGTVREDYSADGDAWSFFPHDQARSRVYRWNEDGLAGICDDNQVFCLAFAFWNGVDPILKERAFGLTNAEGNHGEDVKENWWYLDATPTHSWLRWRYHYPQRAFPYAQLIAENGRRGRAEPEFELADTGVFADGRYWEITVDYAKAAPTDLCIRVSIANTGADEATLHVLPHLWFRNIWNFSRAQRTPPQITGSEAVLVADSDRSGRLVLVGAPLAGVAPIPLLCDNETNTARIFGSPGPAYPKDGINDHVVHGAATVNPKQTGTKGALWYQVSVPGGGRTELRLRLTHGPDAGDTDRTWEQALRDREREADVFWSPILPADPSKAVLVRQALSGVLWSKQFYHYDVDRWLTGDPGNPAPPPERTSGRNAGWRHLDNHDVLIMPDKWEYPWYAAWDLAFHCIAVAHVDPTLAKEQLLLLCREWYMHPNGQLPAYEWNFSDVNPPVHARAALRVFELDGGQDLAFLERIFTKLVINFTWWVNRQDQEGNNLFEGGFLGLDNIGPFDRSSLPVPGVLEQSDGTGWMARYCLDLLEIALTLARRDPTYTDVAIKFFEHFAYISAALCARGLWDEDDGFFYDVLRTPSGERIPMRYRSMVGLVPLAAVLCVDEATLAGLPEFSTRMQWFLDHRPQFTHGFWQQPHDGRRLLSVVSPDQLRRLVGRLLDESEFLSPHGLRSLSAVHRDQPFTVTAEGVTATVDYEPGVSRSGLFGGNSNWRGPVWLPVNYLLVNALRRFHRGLGAAFTVPFQGAELSLAQAADEIANRVVGLYLPGPDGRVPADGDGNWPAGHLWFHEYFDGDTGAGVGASHQTGWTALVANLALGD